MHSPLEPLHPLAGRAPPRQRGFTLVELIIAIGLIGLLARVATLMWVDGFGLVTTINNDTTAIADSRIVLERLSREIREVKYNISAGAYCISTMTPTQMVFNKTNGTYTNICGGASPTGSPVSNDFAVNVQLSGTTLNLGYAGNLAVPAVASAVLTPYVSTVANSFAIDYLQADGSTAATSNSNVRFVRLTLTLIPPGGQNTVSRTTVALRNY